MSCVFMTVVSFDQRWLRVCIGPFGSNAASTVRTLPALRNRLATLWKQFVSYVSAAPLDAAQRIADPRAVEWEGASHRATLAARCRSSRCGDHGTEWPHP